MRAIFLHMLLNELFHNIFLIFYALLSWQPQYVASLTDDLSIQGIEPRISTRPAF